MLKVTIIGVDLAKNVFQLHGATEDGTVVFRKKLSRPLFERFMAGHHPCTVAMEASAGAHHWARKFAGYGYQVRLIAPHYVKPFVKRQKNDAADAEAIVEAALTQNLGAGSIACRMDAGAFEDAVGLATTRLKADVADLVILNKFGLSEAEGRGFRALIVEALGIGLPVLIGLSPTHRVAFECFSGGLATSLPPYEGAILEWYQQEASARAPCQ